MYNFREIDFRTDNDIYYFVSITPDCEDHDLTKSSFAHPSHLGKCKKYVG